MSRNIWLRLVLAFIALASAYVAFLQAGWTPVFWLLVLLSVVCVVASAVPTFRRILNDRKRKLFEQAAIYCDHSAKIQTLQTLIEELLTVEKAVRLGQRLGANEARAIAVMNVEGRLGVLLNIGKTEGTEVGTPLVVYRVDEATDGGASIENELGIVRITYIQAGNNCAQAQVIQMTDEGFWSEAKTLLKRKKHLDPPHNIVVPYVPRELTDVTLANVAAIRSHLTNIRGALVENAFAPHAYQEVRNDSR